jgi:hypothetical protein
VARIVCIKPAMKVDNRQTVMRPSWPGSIRLGPIAPSRVVRLKDGRVVSDERQVPRDARDALKAPVEAVA